MFNMWTPESGISCVINEFMGDLEQCQSNPPPALCCEGAAGTIYTTLKISDDEVLIGGEFINTFSLDANTNGVNPNSDAGDVLQFKVGYVGEP